MVLALAAEVWRDKVIRIESSFHIIEPITMQRGNCCQYVSHY